MRASLNQRVLHFRGVGTHRLNGTRGHLRKPQPTLAYLRGADTETTFTTPIIYSRIRAPGPAGSWPSSRTKGSSTMSRYERREGRHDSDETYSVPRRLFGRFEARARSRPRCGTLLWRPRDRAARSAHGAQPDGGSLLLRRRGRAGRATIH